MVPFLFKSPTTKKHSVSLTLLLVSFALLAIAGCLQLFGVVKDANIFDTLFITSTGLYFGRKVNISKGSKEISEGNGD